MMSETCRNDNKNSEIADNQPDVLSVKLVPEKKGLFLKHSEYEISSKKHKCTVSRRYNDFVNLYNLFLTKYPYRMIPRLPPKQLMLDSLLEERRRGLQRWLVIVTRHIILGNCILFKCFLTDTTTEHQEHLRDIFGKDSDEFSKLSEDVELPLEDQGRLAASREIMRAMLTAVIRLKKLVDQHAARTNCQAKDMAELTTILKVIGTSDKIFEQNTFNEMTLGYQNISKLSERFATIQTNSICERLNLLLDVLSAHSDLCDRVEKGIVSEHQRAISKMLTLNKQKIKGVIRGTAAESVAALHEREVVQTGVVGTLGRRSAFSLYCVLQETSLAQHYLEVLPSILLSFTHEINQEHSEIAKVLNKIISLEADKLS